MAVLPVITQINHKHTEHKRPNLLLNIRTKLYINMVAQCYPPTIYNSQHDKRLYTADSVTLDQEIHIQC